MSDETDIIPGMAIMPGAPCGGAIGSSFANAPVSLNEIRAERSENSADWTPRDMLIALLRDIDNGTRNVTDAVVTFSTDNGEGYSFFNATKDKAVAVFLLERAKHRMMEGK